ncbi:SRPBCC family protein [Shimia ponticola]|uniref:SRPBCC family protein n=1 Tax=Shimia ponticola TaxID=2582893 RepID=UPI0011BDB776|nr:SRPBCC family protein [Shimia ponticola]
METDSLTFTRVIAAPPARVFELYTDSDARQIWNSPGEDFTTTVTHPAQTAPGVRETALVTAENEPDTVVHTDWTTVTPDAVAYAETLEVEGAPLAASFTCATFEDADGGTRLTLEIALTSFAGPEMLEGYKMGCTAAFDALVAAAAGANA